MRKNKIVFVSGQFNILHPGHLRLFRFAKELGDRLFVGVLSDKISTQSSLVKEKLRLEVVKANTWVDKAFILSEPPEVYIKSLKPDFIVKGKEYENLYNPEADFLKTYGGKIVFSSGENIFSSFDLINQESFLGAKALLNNSKEFMRRHSIKVKDILTVVKDFKKLKICVIGDIIIDEYITCDPIGMSQEDPTIVVTPLDKQVFLGGAGIVAAHAASLGAKVHFFSVLGDDSMFSFTRKKLKEYNVFDYLLKDNSRPTTLKQRFRANAKTLLRVNHLKQFSINKELQKK